MPPIAKNLVGRKFGRLTVVSKAKPTIYLTKKRKSFLIHWNCICDCGTRRRVSGQNLLKGQSQSCGCRHGEISRKVGRLNRVDLTGKKFGRLTVIKFYGRISGKVHWLCRCDCGNKCHINASSLVRGYTKSCHCLAQETRRGKNHWHWMGGITPESEKIRKSIEYRIWREAVFQRDNWTCQDCGKRGTYLHAHHIKPFARFPELRLALDNGRTLCIKCHDKKRIYYGRKRNRSSASLMVRRVHRTIG